MTQLYLHEQADTEMLLKIAGENGVALTREAIKFACEKLSSEWLTLVPAGGPICICSLSMSHEKKGSVGLSLPQWAEIVESLYWLRDNHGINEQVRRLSVSSHERLDTALVVVIAGRYKARAWEVAFEANGRGCSDLKVSDEDRQFYVEVKRENIQDHNRHKTFSANAHAVVEGLFSALGEWLDRNNLRVEVKLSRGFSSSFVAKICSELGAKVPDAPLHLEQTISILPDSKFVVQRREDDPHFKKGFIVGRVTIKEAGVPVQIHPRNMPVKIVFEWSPNIAAIARLIRGAKRQLSNDAVADPAAKGFIVIQAAGGVQLGSTLEKRLLHNLPRCCLGVVLLPEMPGESGQIVFQAGVNDSTLAAMTYARGWPTLSSFSVDQR
jgi:hypothetical protein